MKKLPFVVLLAALLTGASALLYVLHYAVFRDAHHIWIYLLGDVAFLPVEVLLVTLVLHRLLEVREKRAMLDKMNMVIGAFFSEVGTELLARCRACEVGGAAASLAKVGDWTPADFARARKAVAEADLSPAPSREEIAEMREFLIARRPFLLALLENPNLLEHESFTELLWAVFHLTEELAHRRSVETLPDSDLAHLAGDLTRAYGRLVREWIAYMRHLKAEYPYLFSLAVRTNPFNASADVEVRS